MTSPKDTPNINRLRESISLAKVKGGRAERKTAGEWLELYREKAGIVVPGAASVTGVSVDQWRSMASGESPVTHNVAERIIRCVERGERSDWSKANEKAFRDAVAEQPNLAHYR